VFLKYFCQIIHLYTPCLFVFPTRGRIP
jgi:hypothetical protein